MIRISYDLDDSEDSGKHKFFSRLKKELAQKGYEEVGFAQPADIHLFVNKISLHARFNVFRIDGIWMNTETKDWKARNKVIAGKMKQASAIVYQNEFCQQATEIILGRKHPKVTCIFNGASKEEFNVKPYQHDKPYFLAMCKWRPHKRLRETIDGFLLANVDADLIVIGEPTYKVDHKSVIYKNWQDRASVASLLAGCIGTVHLCWVDWCPNSVIESLMTGKQVIHTNSGGTPFVVKERGYQVDDEPWKFNICNLYNPPPLGLNLIAEAYRKSLENPIKDFQTDDIDIKNVANQYDSFFKQLSISN